MVSRPVPSDNLDLIEDLKRHVMGDVRFDDMTRALYSTDASIYQIEPIGVVSPASEDDVIAVLEIAKRYKVPVLPRGAGTSLGGQAVGHAVIVDFSRYMRDVLEVNVDEGWVRTQPGVILDELNRHLEPTGFHFAPDPSTSNRSNVGGALGNNSCGAHSIVWGKTIDNVSELRAVLSNGDVAILGSVDQESLLTKTKPEGLEADIYRTLFEIGEINREEILARYPKILRRVSGYNLDELVKDGCFDMARFVVGSEGTLLTITEAKLRIVPLPKMKALAVMHFRELIESIEATVAIRDLGATAVELIDSTIIRQARTNLKYARMMDFVQDDPEAILIVEVTGDSERELVSKLDNIESRMDQKRLAYAVIRLVKPQDQAKVWAVRKAGLGLMMNVRGESKPLPFVEDTAVAPEVLPEYVRRFNEIVQAHGTTAGYYGHASVGCLHIRPLLNLKLQEGVDSMVSIATQVSDLVLEFGGAMSGEHGDGLVRSVWNEKMFGSQLYEAFGQVKRVFDPEGIMNPGKIVDALPITENLRTAPGDHTIDIATSFPFLEQEGMVSAVEMCNGQGACRKLDGVMCPSYMVTRDEEHSTRGRANALRAAISGALPTHSFTGDRLYEVLDLCLECKGCKAECPSNVDMARLKYEFLDQYHKENGFSIRDRLFAHIAHLSRIGSFLGPVANWSLRIDIIKEILDNHIGIDRRRNIPTFSSQTFAQWFKVHQSFPSSSPTRGQVVLFPDTFTNYNHPELGIAATLVLERLGYQVVLPDTKCCGRPMLSGGMIDSARRNARFNVDTLLPYVKNGSKVVGLEPSCILSFSDDYLDLLGNDPGVRMLAENTMLIEEFILHCRENDGTEISYSKMPGKLLFHGHCHQKALVGTSLAMEVLQSIPGANPIEIQSGCCGMAGSFGFEKEHYDISMKIGEYSLFNPIRSESGDFQVVSEGISCRQQIEHGTGRRAKHLVEVIADAL